MNASLEQNTPYVAVWAGLIAAVLLSMGFAHLGNPRLATLLIFAVAFAKAGMVGYYFMHLKEEPRLIWVVLASGFVVVALVLFGLIPDIVYQFGHIA